MERGARIGVLLVMATLGGCYSYLPTRPESVPLGEAVRLRLTEQEAANFPDLRLDAGRLLEGRLFRVTDAAVTVETMIGVNDPQRGTRALMQRVDVPMDGMIELERRQLERARTGFLVGGGAAVLTAIVVAQLQGSGGDDDGPGGGNNEARIVPLFRFGWSF
jgi:hypothetical protein